MAVTPIEIFAPQQTGLLGLFGGAQQALSQALNNSIQLGRDIANNASAQERDFLGEQKAAIAFDERKGVRLQDQANADRTFNETARRNDRDYARKLFEDERDFEMETAKANRSAAYDAVNFDYKSKEDNRAERKLKVDETEATAKLAAEQAAKQFNRDLLKPEAEDPGLTGVPVLGGLGLKDAEDSPAVRAADADLRLKAAVAEKDVEGARRAARDKALAEEKTGGETAAQRLARERLDISIEQNERRNKRDDVRDERVAAKEDREAVEDELKILAADRKAFKPQRESLEFKPGFAADGVTRVAVDPAAENDATVADKDPVVFEKTVATSGLTRDEYIAKGGDSLSKALKEKRGRFYDLVTKAVPATESPSAKKDPYEQFLVPK